jgi:hypothetical protein
VTTEPTLSKPCSTSSAILVLLVLVLYVVPNIIRYPWWAVRSLVQVIYWVVMLAAALAVLVALGGVFVWLDRQ